MLLVPKFYDSAKVGKRFVPDIATAMNEGLKMRLGMARHDKEQRALLIVDPQIDFVMDDGSLSVKGAVGDVRRLIEFIFENAESLSAIIVSLDQHLPFQIFYPTWWRDEKGNAPAPFTPITALDVKAGKWMPQFRKDWSMKYVETLGTIIIWPIHCMIGTEGAAVVPALAEAIAWHSAARNAQPQYVFKGTVPESEHYGPFSPCVTVPNHPQGGLNTPLLDAMGRYEAIYVGGEAEDFCVREGMKQLLTYFGNKPDVLKRMRFLKDCTSLVFPDKRKEADKVLDDMAHKGVQIVTTKDPVCV